MHRFVRGLLAGGLCFAVFACDDDTGPTATEEFQASLSGQSEVPAVTTTASATATFAVIGNQLNWELQVADIDSVTGAHIHAGAAGANGGIMVDLMPLQTGLDFTGILTLDSATVADSVLTRMRNGTAYVNVHTKANPGGEIRGQVETQ